MYGDHGHKKHCCVTYSFKHDEDEDGKLPCHLIGTKRAASPWRKPGDVLDVCYRCALEMCSGQNVR